jgi:hypothetical protein
MKVLKWLLAGAAMLLLVLGGAAWWFYANIDSVIERAITRYGSQMTQARVSVDAVHLRGTDGAGSIRGLTVGNPAGFRSPHALKVGLIEVAVDVRTIADPVVVIQRILIDAPDVIYEKGTTQTNFEALQKNIAGALGSAKAGGEGAVPAPRKLIVDELVIRHAHARATAGALAGKTVSATLPDVVLRRLGRKEGGLTPAQLGEVIARSLGQRLAESLGFERMLKSIGDRIKGLFDR